MSLMLEVKSTIIGKAAGASANRRKEDTTAPSTGSKPREEVTVRLWWSDPREDDGLTVLKATWFHKSGHVALAQSSFT